MEGTIGTSAVGLGELVQGDGVGGRPVAGAATGHGKVCLALDKILGKTVVSTQAKV